MDDVPPRREADLALELEGRERAGRDCGIEIRVVEHDERVVAAELERHLLEASPGQLADTPARGGRTVNDTIDTFGSVTSASPTSAPPTTIWSTPSGSPASRKTASNIAPPMIGVCGSGLRTTALPRASAGATTRIPSTLGEFHGVIVPITPTGIRRTIDSRPGTTVGTSEPYGCHGSVAAAEDLAVGEVRLVVHLAVRGAGLAHRPRPELGAVRLVDVGGPAQDARPLLVRGLGPGRLRLPGGGGRSRDVVGRGARGRSRSAGRSRARGPRPARRTRAPSARRTRPSQPGAAGLGGVGGDGGHHCPPSGVAPSAEKRAA